LKDKVFAVAIDQGDRTVVTAGPTTTARAVPFLGGVFMRRSFTLLFPGLFALALLAPATLLTTSPVAAAPLAAVGACSTGVGNAGGEGIICQVTIVNTITATGGSATVTVHECLGSAGDPTDGAITGHPCTTTTYSLSTPITSVIQCDGSASGGGGKLLCSLAITNSFVGIDPGATAVTVNQCVGSGGGITTGCNPLQSTTGAAITQCNGSANGGGASLTCSATGTMASALVVTINQCNGSANGGGALVNCSASMVNAAVGATSSPSASVSSSPTASGSPSPTASGSPTASASLSAATAPPATVPPTSTVGGGSSNSSTPQFALLICLALGGLAAAAVVTQRRRINS
jgi:hypothetical protein